MSKKLSKQQQRRIAEQHDSKLGDQHHDHAAIVVAHMGYQTIVDDQGTLLAADWRKSLGDIAVNDRVRISKTDATHAVIEAIHPRQQTLYKWQGRKPRAVASHVAQLLVVIAAKPQWQSGLIDRYLIAAYEAGISVAIACNKLDLLDEAAQNDWQQELAAYHQLNYTLFPLSVHQSEGIDALKTWLDNKETVICGQSGVGKSSLIRTLVPDSDIWVQSLSEVTNLGRHTTTNSRRYPLPGGGAVIDTPGVRGFAVTHLTREDIICGFRDIAPFVGQCRFSNCSHQHEPDCAVLEAVNKEQISAARYHSMMQILEEHPS
ncbi:ribosome small subunit-dependent GTPase A [Suttonella sp. R2A3]|uniref:ribosome small subunit-dependent GTPase A n=1 Tax=Suttonella sp. R2A3 TaxID=2908648 RepID=UPI001F369582|nr:ribosome small subunit-dependent GTPase A [Suttonella sp. R2A3]UJF23721.1 ribosome small subunit-dependent GTPase A [Suttonella sp. R2A3]